MLGNGSLPLLVSTYRVSLPGSSSVDVYLGIYVSTSICLLIYLI